MERIDAFVAREVKDSGLPGIAIAVLRDGDTPHVRGFGHDGNGRAISGDTPFPIGSLTKSFTALLIRQEIEAGHLDTDTPVQHYLPWFRVADPQASSRITLRHLLNQTSGLARADGMVPLLQRSEASIADLARGLDTVTLNRPVGERFEYSNLNYLLLGEILQAVTNQPWESLIRDRVLKPLAMTHSHTGHDFARRDGMTQLHRMWFGMPVAQTTRLPPGFAPAGSLVASANDMARYLQMLLADGETPGGRVVSAQGVAQLLAPASPPSGSKLLSADFQFRYGEGWFVGPFGAAADARWHLGNLASFAAWMVLLPDTKQAVVVLINANTEMPFNEVNAVMSRLPIGVVNLLRGQPVPQGPSLRSAYLPFNAVVAFAFIGMTVLAWWATRTRRAVWSVLMLLIAIAMVVALQLMGLNASILLAFAPDFALVLAAVGTLLCLPATLRVAAAFLRPRSTAPITDGSGNPLPGSIACLERVMLGGVEQGLLIRGHSVANPVLLYLHGGPGTSELGMVRVHNIPVLEKHFTVVVWDQRGAGLSYAARHPESGMTVEQFIADAHELTLLLCRRFQQPRIYLVGHSWGSVLGALAVHRHADLYYAYVGVGQAVDMQEGERISYAWTLAQAEKAGDARSVAQLKKIGPPPYTGTLRSKLMTQRRILGKYGGEVHGNPHGGMPTLLRGLIRSSEYSWPDRINVFRGIFANMRLMWPKILSVNLMVQVPEIGVPVYFLEGRFDYEAPAELAERYLQMLKAPRKELVWFERSAHFVNTEEANGFNRFFVDRLLRETYRPEVSGVQAISDA